MSKSDEATGLTFRALWRMEAALDDAKIGDEQKVHRLKVIMENFKMELDAIYDVHDVIL
jgi:hypothetical protein